MSWTNLERDLYLHHIFLCPHLELNVSSPALLSFVQFRETKFFWELQKTRRFSFWIPLQGCVSSRSSDFPQETEDKLWIMEIKLWKRMAQHWVSSAQTLGLPAKVMKHYVWGGFYQWFQLCFLTEPAMPGFAKAVISVSQQSVLVKSALWVPLSPAKRHFCRHSFHLTSLSLTTAQPAPRCWEFENPAGTAQQSLCRTQHKYPGSRACWAPRCRLPWQGLKVHLWELKSCLWAPGWDNLQDWLINIIRSCKH